MEASAKDPYIMHGSSVKLSEDSQMIKLKALIGFLSLAAISGTAFGGNSPTIPLDPNTIPVLVKVDAAGKVTEATPSLPLSGALESLLRANIQEMIVAPASNASGRNIDSQFVASMTLVTEPADNGKLSAHFSQTSIEKLPNTGRWYWAHSNNTQPALAMTAYQRTSRPWKLTEDVLSERMPSIFTAATR